MRDMGAVAEKYSEKFPHMKTYNKCQSKAFVTGLLTTISGAAAAFVLQDMLASRLPYSRKAFLIAPVAVGSIMGYVVTQHKTKNCQQMWRALEGKETAINPLPDKDI